MNDTVIPSGWAWIPHRPDYNDPRRVFEQNRGRWTHKPKVPKIPKAPLPKEVVLSAKKRAWYSKRREEAAIIEAAIKGSGGNLGKETVE